MNCNKEEAVRAKGIAETKLRNCEFVQARKTAIRAHQLDPSLDNISQLIMVCDVHCSAEKKFGGEMDWYGILQVQQVADEATIKKQYRKFALLLHPDKNKLPGAEAAFKLIGEAQRILLDRTSRAAHDRKRNASASLGRPGSQGVPYRPPHGANWCANVGMQSSQFGNNGPPQQPAQAGFDNGSQTFWTSCPFCRVQHLYCRNFINKQLTCKNCQKVFVAYSVNFPGAPQASFSQQGSVANESKVDVGSKPTSVPGSQKPAPISKTSKMKVRKREVNRGGRREKRNSSESDILDSESSSASGSEPVMRAYTEPKNKQGHNQCSSDQVVRRSTRQRQNVSYKENGSDEDDIPNPPKKSKGNGESLQSQNGDWEEAKLKREDHSGKVAAPGVCNFPEPAVMKPESVLGGYSGKCDSEYSEDSSDPLPKESDSSQVPEPVFFNFDDAKSPGNFKKGQIWALYSEEESLPKYYGLIMEVTTGPAFKIRWLTSHSLPEGAIRWRDQKMPVSVGRFKIDTVNPDSYDSTGPFCYRLNASTSSTEDGTWNILPDKGEVWALYKNWNSRMRISDLERCEYDLAEVIEADDSSITVGILERASKFSCIQRPKKRGSSRVILRVPLVEILRFSHRVPAYQLTEQKKGIFRGFWEVDSLAVPPQYFLSESK